MQQVFNIPESIKKGTNYTFCPGCGHGVAIRLLCQAIDEFNVRENTIAMVGVGCSAFLYHFLKVCIAASFNIAMCSADKV